MDSWSSFFWWWAHQPHRRANFKTHISVLCFVPSTTTFQCKQPIIQIESPSFGLCPSCNRYVKNKSLLFGSRLFFRLQARRTKSIGLLRSSYSHSLGTTETLTSSWEQKSSEGSQCLIYTCECFIGTQWMRVAWSKESNRFGASCLKTEEEPASKI